MEGFPEIREGLYSFLSSVFNTPPDIERLKMLDDPDVRDTILTLSPSSEVVFKWKEDNGKIKEDFNKLFMVPSSRYLKPYESIYLDRVCQNGVQSEALLMGPSTINVKKHYERAGFKISSSLKELPDYIGVELEFMASLVKLENEMKADNDSKSRIIQMEIEFLKEHLSKWTNFIVQGIVKNADSNFYRGIAFLLEGFINMDLEYLLNYSL